MPKMSKDELKNVRYVSMIDFSNKINQFEDVIDKRRFAVQYLLTFGLAGNTDYSLPEAIHFVRAKLSESVKDNNTDDLTKAFLANPVGYLKTCAVKEANRYNSNQIVDDNMIGEHYYNLAEDLNNQVANQVSTLDRYKNAFDVKTRMEIKLGGKNELDKLVKDTKPGFFSKLFNTSSAQAKALDNAYKEFVKPSSRNYGNLNTLEEAAVAYLTYKIPNWNNEKPLPKIEDLEGLDKTSKARALMSIKAIEASKEQRKIENSFVGMGNARNVNNIKIDELLASEENEANYKNDIKFENSLKEDVNENSDLKQPEFIDNQIKSEVENENQI